MNPIRPTAPTTSGTIVLQEFHGYIVPPQVIGIKKLVQEAMKMVPPTQSIRLNLAAMLAGMKFSLRKTGIMTNPIPQKGRLIQKTQVHETLVRSQINTDFAKRNDRIMDTAYFSEKTPPRTGPRTLPRAHIVERKPKYFPRSL